MTFPAPLRRGAAPLLAALAVAVAGCAGGPPPAQLYRLDTTAPAAAPAPAASTAAGIWLLSPRVELPEYLQREAIVVAGPTRLEPLEGRRWAEPLRDALPRVLQADLEALRGPGQVWSGPLPPGLAAATTLRVEIVELHADAARRTVRLVARWTLADPGGATPPRSGRAAFDEPAGDGSVDALVQAHRRALWRLALGIAAS